MKRLKLCGNDWNWINLGRILQSSMIRNRIVVRGKTIKWESNICIFPCLHQYPFKKYQYNKCYYRNWLSKKEDI